MTLFQSIQNRFSRWIDAVALATVSILDRASPPRVVTLVEDQEGLFVQSAAEDLSVLDGVPLRLRLADGRIESPLSNAQRTSLSGSRIELILRPDHFMFRPLELPKRATEFLNGIVRTQIDRLTPWNSSDAAFGWSKPLDSDGDRMTVTIAATAAAALKPYTEALSIVSPRSIAISTTLPDEGADQAPIKLWDEQGQGGLNSGPIRRALLLTLAITGLIMAVTLVASTAIRESLVAEQQQLARQLAKARSAAGAAQSATLQFAPASQRGLARRKHDAPLSVMVLESLSQILPEHTYLTELRIEGSTLRISGISNDAPSLIGLIEKSNQFTRATFFAATTRSQSQSGERFHIEAVIKPIGSSSS
jgi:general secretion pathway protein L